MVSVLCRRLVWHSHTLCRVCDYVRLVCEQNFWTTNNIGTSIELSTDVKDQEAFSKTFWL